MFRLTTYLFLTLFAQPGLYAQSGLDGAIPLGPGITFPRVLYKVEPEYSPEARADHIQGSVVVQLAIDDKGKPTGVTVISPLGFGLDERAEAAVEKWEFKPASKEGKPVKVLATVQVNFRLEGIAFDEKTERRRTSFNTNLRTLNRPNSSPGAVGHAVKTMQDLARQKFIPAIYMIGVWEASGEHVPKDPLGGLALIQKAAAKNYGPALYEIAIRKIEGRDMAKDSQNGMEMMHHASILGSPKAQFYLGDLYETGTGVAREPESARRYYRLCAAQGVPACQYRLAKLLFDAPDRPERDYVQAIAWFQLAAEQGFAAAKDIEVKETAKMTPAQLGI